MDDLFPWIVSVFFGFVLLSTAGSVYKAASRHGWGPVVAAPFAGAFAAAFGWFFVNGISRTDGVGFLEGRAPWPISDFYLSIAIGAALETLAGIAGALGSRSRGASIASAARDAGLSHRERVGPEEVADYGLKLFDDFGKATNAVRGERAGVSYEILDYDSKESIRGGEKSRTIERRRTILIMPASTEKAWRRFEVTPATRFSIASWGPSSLRLESLAPDAARPEERTLLQRFEQAYRVTADPDQADEVARHFDWRAVRLFAAEAGWNVESSGSHVAYWRGNRVASAAERESLAQGAVLLHDALRPVDQATVRLIADYDLEVAKKRIRLFGLVAFASFAGGVFASFLAFVAFGIVFFSVDSDAAGPVALAWPFVGMGAFLGGAYLTSRLVRRFR